MPFAHPYLPHIHSKDVESYNSQKRMNVCKTPKAIIHCTNRAGTGVTTLQTTMTM